MQKELIDNLIAYINCFFEREDQKNEFIAILQTYQHHDQTWLFLYEIRKHIEYSKFDTIIKILSLGFLAIEYFQNKPLSDHQHWAKIRRLEKDRKNIIPYINALKDSLEIYESIDNQMLIKHAKIGLAIFESFLKDDDLTIEKLSLAHFVISTLHYSREYDEENDTYVDVPFDPQYVIKEDDWVKSQLQQFFPEVEPFIEFYGDIDYLASLLDFFEGYRITPQMILKSMAIKLYNYPLWIYPHKLDSINKSALKKSIETLLLPYSDTEKFSLDIKKAKSFYVKTYFHSSPILALEGKNNKSQYQSLFNPERYYSSLQDDPEKYNSNKIILNSMFFTN